MAFSWLPSQDLLNNCHFSWKNVTLSYSPLVLCHPRVEMSLLKGDLEEVWRVKSSRWFVKITWLLASTAKLVYLPVPIVYEYVGVISTVQKIALGPQDDLALESGLPGWLLWPYAWESSLQLLERTSSTRQSFLCCLGIRVSFNVKCWNVCYFTFISSGTCEEEWIHLEVTQKSWKKRLQIECQVNTSTTSVWMKYVLENL